MIKVKDINLAKDLLNYQKIWIKIATDWRGRCLDI